MKNAIDHLNHLISSLQETKEKISALHNEPNPVVKNIMQPVLAKIELQLTECDADMNNLETLQTLIKEAIETQKRIQSKIKEIAELEKTTNIDIENYGKFITELTALEDYPVSSEQDLNARIDNLNAQQQTMYPKIRCFNNIIYFNFGANPAAVGANTLLSSITEAVKGLPPLTNLEPTVAPTYKG